MSFWRPITFKLPQRKQGGKDINKFSKINENVAEVYGRLNNVFSMRKTVYINDNNCKY